MLARWLFAAGVALLAVGVPLGLQHEPYLIHMYVLIALYALLALSLNLVWGLAGQFSMAQVAFYAIGAYGTSVLVAKAQWAYWPALLAAVVVALLSSLLIGYCSLRLTGMYFAIVTLGFGQLINTLIVNVPNVTGGAYGLQAQYRPDPLGVGPLRLEFAGPLDYYWLALATLVLGLALIYRLSRSRTGRAMSATREDERLAESIGVHLQHYKLAAFALSSVIAALAGGYFAPYITFISPSMFGFRELINMILMLVVGGTGTMAGPVIGAALFVILPEALRVAGNVRLGIYGAILILVVIFLPRGLAGMPGLIGAWLQSRRSGKEPSRATTTAPAAALAGPPSDSSNRER